MQAKSKQISLTFVPAKLIILLALFGLSLLMLIGNEERYHIPDYKSPGDFQYFNFSDSVDFDRNLKINFDVKLPPASDQLPVYQNIFQTSDFNGGLRLELTRTGLDYSWGFAFNTSGGKLQGLDLGTVGSESSGNLVHIELEILNSPEKKLIVHLNGSLVKIQKVPGLNIRYDRVATGFGFGDRAFYGTIENFEISFETKINNLGWILLAFTICFGIYYATAYQKIITTTEKIILLAILMVPCIAIQVITLGPADGTWILYAKELTSGRRLYTDLGANTQPLMPLLNQIWGYLFGFGYISIKALFLALSTAYVWVVIHLVSTRVQDTTRTFLICFSLLPIGIHFEAFRFDD